MKITVEHEDGTTEDITHGVQVAYDGITSSMDWSSGFLSTEEVSAIIDLSRACRFSDYEELYRGHQKELELEEQRQARREQERQAREAAGEAVKQHIQDRDTPQGQRLYEQILRDIGVLPSWDETDIKDLIEQHQQNVRQFAEQISKEFKVGNTTTVDYSTIDLDGIHHYRADGTEIHLGKVSDPDDTVGACGCVGLTHLENCPNWRLPL